MSDSLGSHGLQHARLPHPSLSPRICSKACPLSRWWHLNIPSLCHPLLPLPSIFLSIRIFSNELALPIRWPKYWSFSISPSNAQSRLIFYTIDWFDLFRYHRIFRITLGSCLDISFGSFYLSIYPLIQVNWIHKSINLQTIPIYWFIIGDTNSTIKIYEVSHSWQGARYICRKMDASGLY